MADFHFGDGFGAVGDRGETVGAGHFVALGERYGRAEDFALEERASAVVAADRDGSFAPRAEDSH